MNRRWIEAALLIGLAIATPSMLAAQQRQHQPTAPAFEHDPDLDAADQLAPSQLRQPMPAAVAEPTGGNQTRAAAHGGEPVAEPGTAGRPLRAATLHVVACNGVFGRDSSHVKLAMAFQSRNVAFAQVDAGSGGKVMASVLFAKDPKRRLEVWWSNPSSRSNTHLIVINGGSDWIAPGDLHLGLTLAELEQLNGKPFKLLGFGKDNVATLSDWNGGGLGALPGGCKVGMSLRAPPSAPAAAISAFPADREFTSVDAALRAVNPTVSEILVKY